ncbi:MAG: MBL fold metallo-hydrolase [Proteobacteria bacterium]|nr:MBL fold metallo-hydrolase [Pseudomonadota bacterium]
MPTISRRSLLAAGVTGAALAATRAPSRAAAPAAGTQAAGFYRYRIGRYELTALNDGVWNRQIDAGFIANAPFAQVQQAMADAFMPPGRLAIPFTSLAVNTGPKLVLIDTGTGGQLQPVAPQSGTWSNNLAAAGIAPASVDIILISHFHPDHINGIKTKDGQLTFPNAAIHVPAAEWAYWMDDARMNAAPEPAKPAFRNARRIFSDIARDVSRFAPGAELAPGIIAIAAPGHTPGHTVFAIASDGQSMLALGDTTNNPWLFVRNPDWQAAFDIDGPMAAATRKALLARAAADRMLVHGYHFPFPAAGHITRGARGYDLVPAMWQATL